MVLLPGCGCCGGGEPYTCWRNLDSLICKPTSEGVPGLDYVAVDQYDDSGGCIQCQFDPLDAKSWCYDYYNDVGFVASEQFIGTCPDESSPLVAHINAKKGNITSYDPFRKGYALLEFQEMFCVDYTNPLPDPPPSYDRLFIVSNAFSYCNADPCKLYWNNGGDLRVGGRAYSSDPNVIDPCFDLRCRGEYEELKDEFSLGPFEYCQDCFGPPFEAKESRVMQAPTKEEPMTQTIGPGTHLKNMLKWFNIHAKEKGCGCKSMQKKMDKNGAQWCRNHKEEILNHLAKEAQKRGLPFVKLAASKLLDLAIRRAERGQ